MGIDPRFIGGSSHDTRHFIRNYQFINDCRRDEIGQLTKTMRLEQDPEKKQKLRSMITSIKNKMVEQERKTEEMNLVTKMKSNHKKGYHVKKSDIKKQTLVQKFKELKETGKLTKYMERKRKKNIKRDEKSMAQ